jgi:hypothetical protein
MNANQIDYEINLLLVIWPFPGHCIAYPSSIKRSSSMAEINKLVKKIVKYLARIIPVLLEEDDQPEGLQKCMRYQADRLKEFISNPNIQSIVVQRKPIKGRPKHYYVDSSLIKL